MGKEDSAYGEIPDILVLGTSHQNNPPYFSVKVMCLSVNQSLHFPKMSRQVVAFSANYVYYVGPVNIEDNIIGGFAICCC